MNSWAKVMLSDVAEVFNGKTPSKVEQRNEGHPVLKIRDVSEFGKFRGKHESFVDPSLAKKYLMKQIQEDDTLILNAAHNADYVGSKTYRAEPPVFGTLATGEWLIIRPAKGKLDAGFVHHWVTSKTTRSAIRNVVNGIHLYPKDVARLDISLPPLPEQRRIAAILDQADALRAKRREALAQLDSLTQSIFFEMFGDPSSNPKGWVVNSVYNFTLSVTNGMTRRRIESDKGTDIVLRLRDIRSGWIDFSEINRITLKPNESEKYSVSSGDLLFIRVNGNPDYVGRCAVFEDYSEPVFFNDHIMRVKVDQSKIHCVFLAFLLNGAHGKNEIAKHRKTSAGQHTINQEGLGKIQVPIPPLPLQAEFIHFLESISKQRIAFMASQAQLDALFASLQYRAFRGEL